MLRKAFNSVAMIAVVASAGAMTAGGGTGAAQAEATGFPSGQFRIIGQDSKLCLASEPGGGGSGRDEPGKDRGAQSEEYHQRHGYGGYTSDPTVGVHTCGTGVPQRWSDEKGLLVNKDESSIRGRYALHCEVDPFTPRKDSKSDDPDNQEPDSGESDGGGPGGDWSHEPGNPKPDDPDKPESDSGESYNPGPGGDWSDDPDYDVVMYGAGSINTAKWETADGYIWAKDNPNKVLTYNAEQKKLILTDKGSANQKWSFDPVE